MTDTISVLVVDEDEDVLELTQTFLERASKTLSVATATSGRAALDHVEEHDVDCIVSDYRMPGMDGMELFEAVEEMDPSLPFLLFSAAVERDFDTTIEVRETFADIEDREQEILEDLPEMDNDRLLQVREVLVSLQQTAQYAVRNAEIATNLSLNEESDRIAIS